MLLQLEAHRLVVSKNLAIFLEAASSGRSISGEGNRLNGSDVNDRPYTVKVWQYGERNVCAKMSILFLMFQKPWKVRYFKYFRRNEADKTKKKLRKRNKLIAIELPFESRFQSLPRRREESFTIFSRKIYKTNDRWSSVENFPMSFVGNFCAASLIHGYDTHDAQVWKMCSPLLVDRGRAFFTVVSRGVTASMCILAIYKASHLRRFFARLVYVSPAVVIIPLPSGRFSLHAIASRYHPPSRRSRLYKV